MKRFARVIEILETAVHGDTIKAHGNFWRGKPLHDFIALKIFGQTLIVPGRAADSAIIKAMRVTGDFAALSDQRLLDAMRDLGRETQFGAPGV